MKKGWVVVWQGKSCSTFLTKDEQWTLDPDEAHVFKSWVRAKCAAFGKRVEIARCWYDGQYPTVQAGL